MGHSFVPREFPSLKHDQIGVIPGRDSSFAIVKSEETGRARAQLFRAEARGIEPARFGAREKSWQQGFNAWNARARIEDRGGQLIFDGPTGVVGRDEADFPVLDRLPERFDLTWPNRWIHLHSGTEGFPVFLRVEP